MRSGWPGLIREHRDRPQKGWQKSRNGDPNQLHWTFYLHQISLCVSLVRPLITLASRTYPKPSPLVGIQPSWEAIPRKYGTSGLVLGDGPFFFGLTNIDGGTCLLVWRILWPPMRDAEPQNITVMRIGLDWQDRRNDVRKLSIGNEGLVA